MSACSPKLKLKTYLEPQANNDINRDSIKASLSVSVIDQGEIQEIKATIFAVPYQRYRVEFRGPMGVSLASLLWSDQDWILLLTRNGLYHSSRGNVMDIENPAFPEQLDFHKTFSMLWGDLLPSKWQTAQRIEQDSTDLLVWKNEKYQNITAIINPKNGFIDEVIFDEYKITYSDYKKYDLNIIPSKMSYYRNDRLLVSLKVNNLSKTKSWKDKIWKLQIPDDFREF